MQCNGWNDDPYRLSWPFAFSQGLGPVQTIGVVVLVLWFVAAALALAGFMAARRRRCKGALSQPAPGCELHFSAGWGIITVKAAGAAAPAGQKDRRQGGGKHDPS